jgi:5'-phosphate synthase pdxT subunit
LLHETYEGAVPVNTVGDLAGLDGLIISGNDFSAMIPLLEAAHLFGELLAFGRHKPVLATGSAACLVSREFSTPSEHARGLIDIAVDCNPNEPELENRTEMLRHEFDDESGVLAAMFIHPPVIRRVGPGVQVIAKYNNAPVLVEQGLHMAATFHPERIRKEASVHWVSHSPWIARSHSRIK